MSPPVPTFEILPNSDDDTGASRPYLVCVDVDGWDSDPVEAFATEAEAEAFIRGAKFALAAFGGAS